MLHVAARCTLLHVTRRTMWHDARCRMLPVARCCTTRVTARYRLLHLTRCTDVARCALLHTACCCTLREIAQCTGAACYTLLLHNTHCTMLHIAACCTMHGAARYTMLLTAAHCCTLHDVAQRTLHTAARTTPASPKGEEGKHTRQHFPSSSPAFWKQWHQHTIHMSSAGVRRCGGTLRTLLQLF